MRKTVLGYKLEMNICTFWKILHVVCFPKVENTFLAANMKATLTAVVTNIID